jgi:hypothetical protein
MSELKNLRGSSRRKFLKWTAATGAALALDRSQILNVVNDTAGSAMADEASCSTTLRSVHLVAGDGGFAWFQLLWPHNEVATSTNNNFAFHAQGQQLKATDTDKTLYHVPQSPWTDKDKTKRISAFMAGVNQTHTPTPTSAATVGAGQSMLAVCSSIQRTNPTLLPVIGITPLAFGTAPGAPQLTTVGNADGMVQLFNSAASRSILEVEKDAQLFEAYYKAFLGLNAASSRPTTQRPLNIGKKSANFLGKNLASLLEPTQDDLSRYGVIDSTPNKLRELAKTLITTSKAFKLGLTSCVVMPVFRDDPHGAFADMNSLLITVNHLGLILNMFMNDLSVTPDPTCTGKTLADNVVITVHGDTPKNPLERSGWPDGTPGNSNWLYVMGNGYTKTGWFGGVKADGSILGFDPTTGNDVPNQPANTTSSSAGAAVAFAVAKGDRRRVEEFYTGLWISGIINQNPI